MFLPFVPLIYFEKWQTVVANSFFGGKSSGIKRISQKITPHLTRKTGLKERMAIFWLRIQSVKQLSKEYSLLRNSLFPAWHGTGYSFGLSPSDSFTSVSLTPSKRAVVRRLLRS
ncbi:hypothetical protein FQA47_022949 [Oryzias melastigma]|uniref:Uncharacterized protein n=1 Tax=Oryzias melastigma TaxID=30732 RepID=A0A834FG49_ORYME|nr:hypothetical protein FQA47_022949 [Oryzias melastigma]